MSRIACAVVAVAMISLASAPAAAAGEEAREEERKTTVRKDVWLTAKDGVRLEASVALPSEHGPVTRLAILCHPHPLYGGTMDNAVLAAIEQALVSRDMAVLRFNFRGVGRSGGEYGEGEKERLDVLAAVAWARGREVPRQRLALVGYSFGAAVAARALDELPSEIAYVGVALPADAHMQGLRGLTDPRRKVLLIAGGQDEIAPPERASSIVKARKAAGAATELLVIQGATHFFETRAHLRAVASAVAEFLARLPDKPSGE